MNDESEWADLAEELGIESKPKAKPNYFSEELPAFPETPWPEDPAPQASGVEIEEIVESLEPLPDAPISEDDTMIDADLANEEFIEESADGGEDGDGKKRRRRRRKKRGGPNEESAVGEQPTEAPIQEPRSMADAIKNLVATWTVPGWNDIVGGLYRPGADRDR